MKLNLYTKKNNIDEQKFQKRFNDEYGALPVVTLVVLVVIFSII